MTAEIAIERIIPLMKLGEESERWRFGHFILIIPACVGLLFPTESFGAASLRGIAAQFPPPTAPPPPALRFFGAIPTPNSPGWGKIVKRSEAVGLLVLAVIPDSPAALAGVSPGDVIVAINEKTVRNDESAVTLLRSGRSNYRMTVIKPDGASRALSVALSRLTDFSPRAFLQANFRRRPNPISQFLVAQGETNPRIALSLADQLTYGRTSFAAAHALKAKLLLEIERATGGRSISPTAEARVIEELKLAMEMDPRSAAIRRQGTRIFLDLNRPGEAEREAKAALAIDDSSAEAHYLLGKASLLLGRPIHALPALHRAVQLNPYGEQYYRELRRCYSRLGEKSSAERTDRARESLVAYLHPKGADANAKVARVGLTAMSFAIVGAFLAAAAHRRSGWGTRGAARVWTQKKPSTVALAESLTALGIWSMVVPFLGPTFGIVPAIQNAKEGIEFVDHILPGFLVFATSLALTLLFVEAASQSKDPGHNLPQKWPELVYAAAPAIALLAGFWITITHLTLIRQAAADAAAWSTAFLHVSAGPAIMLLAAFLRGRIIHGREVETHPGDSEALVSPRSA